MSSIVTGGLGMDGVLITQGYGAAALPGGTFQVIASMVTPTYIDFFFSMPVQALHLQAALPQYWTFTTGGPTQIEATLISHTAPSSVIRVYTSEAKSGDSYTMTFPVSGLKSIYDDVYNGDPTFTYTASAVSPMAYQAQVINNETVRIIYSEAVVASDATNTSNYVITPPLAVLSIVQESPAAYVLTTQNQKPGQSYLITIYNVRDLAGNPV